MIKYIDLFCGAGGLSVGFAKAGFHLDLASDISLEAIKTFKSNIGRIHPDSSKENVIHGDIKDIFKFLNVGEVVEESLSEAVFETLKERVLRDSAPVIKDHEVGFLKKLYEVDLLAVGPPCQGFLLIGRNKKKHLITEASDFVDDPINQLFKYFLKFSERYKPKVVVI